MVMRPMESKNTTVNHVRSEVVRIQHQMGIRKSAGKRLSDYIRSEAACEGEPRTFGVSRNTVSDWLKKKAVELSPLRETLVLPDANDSESTILEIDEIWSFVDYKGNKIWIWMALCRKTRQIVVRAVSDRSEKTCRNQ